MNEDDISREMYQAAKASSKTFDVLSWQAVSGKAYLTRDMRFRVAGKTLSPDLVLLWRDRLWLIEVKGSHAESRVGDEPKLQRLLAELGPEEILRQVATRCKRSLPLSTLIRPAVAYS